MKLSSIVVNFNGIQHTLACVASLQRYSPKFPHEIIVVDNGSSLGEREELKRRLPNCTVLLTDGNRGFGAANNVGASRATGEFLFFLNNDTLATSDVLTPLALFMESHAAIGIAGPALRNDDGTFQVSFGRFPSLRNEWRTRKMGRDLNRKNAEAVGEIDARMREWISGAAMIMRKECFDRLSGFDSSYFMYFEDSDLCYRARLLGYEIGYVKACSLIHLGGMSYAAGNAFIRKEYRRSQLRFYDKFRSWPQRMLIRAYLLLKALIGLEKISLAEMSDLVFASHKN